MEPPQQEQTHGLSEDVRKLAVVQAVDATALQTVLDRVVNQVVLMCHKHNFAIDIFMQCLAHKAADDTTLANTIARIEVQTQKNASNIEDLGDDIRAQWKAWDKRMDDIRTNLSSSSSKDPASAALAAVLDRSAMDDCMRVTRSLSVEVEEAKVESQQAKEAVSSLKEQCKNIERVIHASKTSSDWESNVNEVRAAVDRLSKDVVDVRETAEASLSKANASTIAVEESLSVGKSATVASETCQKELETVQAKMVEGENRLCDMFALKIKEAHHEFQEDLTYLRDFTVTRLEESELKSRASFYAPEGPVRKDLDEVKEIAREAKASAEISTERLLALEPKLEAASMEKTNSAISAATTPLFMKLDELTKETLQLSAGKQDKDEAIQAKDVDAAVSHAVEVASRRIEEMLQTMVGLQSRLESVAETKADRLTAAKQIDVTKQIEEMRDETESSIAEMQQMMVNTMIEKADGSDLARIDKRLSSRLSTLQAAILKGLKTISDKVAAALAEKTSQEDFDAFRNNVKDTLDVLAESIREKSPGARAVFLNRRGASSCLSCDSKVSTTKEFLSAATPDPATVRMFTPDALPEIDTFHSSFSQILATDPVGAAHNARLVKKKREQDAIMKHGLRSSTELMAAGAGISVEHLSSPSTPPTPANQNTTGRFSRTAGSTSDGESGKYGRLSVEGRS
ncbi:hypothetical protein BSKO_08712 [Bryopsis sp. KO-2023]|nr:hypothetical protein BSKO_08712 [Bryopsis sp. KO-2023]